MTTPKDPAPMTEEDLNAPQTEDRASFMLQEVALRMKARLEGGYENVAVGSILANDIVNAANAGLDRIAALEAERDEALKRAEEAEAGLLAANTHVGIVEQSLAEAQASVAVLVEKLKRFAYKRLTDNNGNYTLCQVCGESSYVDGADSPDFPHSVACVLTNLPAATRQHLESAEGMKEALEWYGEQSRLARLIHSGGDSGRNALATDGGERARAALSKAGA